MSDSNVIPVSDSAAPDVDAVSHPSDVERFVAISGSAPGGRSNARVYLKYYNLYSNGTVQSLAELSMHNPIVSVFKHAGFVNVYLDFGSRTNQDLSDAWDMLNVFSRPINKVSYLPEEIESGFYEAPGAQEMVYFPVLDLTLSPVSKKDPFLIHGCNPVHYRLEPNSPKEEPCVLQLVFREASFEIVSESAPWTPVIPELLYSDQPAMDQEDNTSYFNSIAGADADGRPVAHVMLEHHLRYNDGTTTEIQTLFMEKPFAYFSSEDGYVNVYLDFGSNNDADLRMMLKTLKDYCRPSNSVSYLPEELESGFYETDSGPKLVYFPVLDLVMSPIGHEESFAIRGYNPVFFSLELNESGLVSVLHFCFQSETFAVVKDLELDKDRIYYEAMEEKAYEDHHAQ